MRAKLLASTILNSSGRNRGIAWRSVNDINVAECRPEKSVCILCLFEESQVNLVSSNKNDFTLLTISLGCANITSGLATSNFVATRRMVKMMPLSMAKEGDIGLIKKVGGKPETRLFLESLGFVQGSTVTVISRIEGNLIVNVKESRVAISREMANKIMI